MTSLDRVETIYTVPPLMGSGTQRDNELYPGLELSNLEILSNVVYLIIKPHLSGLNDRAHQSEFRL
jgi:hypothetical protein